MTCKGLMTSGEPSPGPTVSKELVLEELALELGEVDKATDTPKAPSTGHSLGSIPDAPMLSWKLGNVGLSSHARTRGA